MHSVIHEKGPEPHVEAPLMQKIDIANDRRPERRQTAGRDTVEDSSDQYTCPGGAICRDDIGNAGQQRRDYQQGPTTVCVRDGQDEQGARSRENEVHGQLV